VFAGLDLTKSSETSRVPLTALASGLNHSLMEELVANRYYLSMSKPMSGSVSNFWMESILERRMASNRSINLSYKHFLISVSRVCKAGKKVIFGKIRKIMKDFFMSHTGSHVFQDVVNSDSHTTNTRLAAAHFGIERDEFSIINWFHTSKLEQIQTKSSENP